MGFKAPAEQIGHAFITIAQPGQNNVDPMSKELIANVAIAIQKLFQFVGIDNRQFAFSDGFDSGAVWLIIKKTGMRKFIIVIQFA